jgi:alginate O-acetyltransferase complex protein AlgJ
MATDSTHPDRLDPWLDREEVARIEVGQTTVHPRLAQVIVVGFLAVLVLLPALEWIRTRDGAGTATTAPWTHLANIPSAVTAALDGLRKTRPEASWWNVLITANRAVLARLTAFESGLDDQSEVGRLLRPPTQRVLSGALGVGNERVYVGREGWLFYRPDIEYVTGEGFLDARQMRRRIASAGELDTIPQPDPRPAIRQFHRDLQARGIVLVLVPTPVKPTIHPGMLSQSYGSTIDEPLQNMSYDLLIDDVARDGVVVFDPALDLVRAHRESGRAQYLATDTHWRPDAVERVAASLANFIRARVSLTTVPSAGYRVEPRQAQQVGDTAVMLDLPPRWTQFRPERVDLRFVVDADGDPWRSSRQADVLVLGDSFSNIYALPSMGWGEAAGFVEHLSFALQRPVDRITQNDDGAYATRELLARELSGSADRLAGKRIVVWQFATRELATGDWRVQPLPGR